MKKYFLLLILFTPIIAFAQLSGSVVDDKGEPLPFVSIYIKGSSTGTTTNIEGNYKLYLDEGEYDLVYQYVGMQTLTRKISIDNEPLKLDIVMTPQASILQEVIVAANAEDPAYRVIREAQKKRKYYQNLIKQFTCDVYVKGNQKILDAPEKIMGMEIGDFDGALDSNRQGIVYLSESISKLYYKEPHKIKEIVHSSKVSGDDRGYSFNTAREMEFNCYDRTLDFSRQFVSPIAENAFSYYDYKLEGTFYEDGHLVNQIKLIRKRDTDPSFYGRVYIIEDLWSVHSLKVGVTSKASQLYFIDSVEVEQVFIPIKEPDVWRIFTNNISFKLGMFGFKLKGHFSATYSDYDLDSPIDDDIFNKEVFVVEKDSNKKDSIYWEENRPTPLTSEEKLDYIKKDSIQEVRESPEYKDSVDSKNNKFQLGNLIGGYFHSRRSKHTYWNISAPLNSIGYNTVQGYTTKVDLSWWKYFDEDETNRIILDGSIGYGFSEKKFRANGRITYRPNRMDRSYLVLTGGTDIKDFTKFAPVDNLRNTLYTLFARQNYAKFYDYSFAKLGFGKEVVNGVNIRAMLGYEKRSPLENNSDISYFYKESRVFTPNNILGAPIQPEHEVFSTELYADFRIGQEYFVYPDRKFSAGNEGPLFSLKYRFLNGIGNDISLHALSASVSDEWVAGARGTSEFYIHGGSVLQKNDLPVMDRFFFRGNQFTISDHSTYNRSFIMLPFYSRSTDGRFFEGHYQHKFDGFIMDKIPGFRDLGFGLVAGGKALLSQGHDPYYEVHLGLDKIGWHIFRILRFDVVMSSDAGNIDWGYRVGVLIN